MHKRILNFVTLNSSLWQRWPDRKLLDNFKGLMLTFTRHCEALAQNLKDPRSIPERVFKDICRNLVEASLENTNREIRNNMQLYSRDIVQLLAGWHDSKVGLSWLQNIASVLGMLMHFNTFSKRPGELVNHRRPQKAYTTYPTSPNVARLLTEYVLMHLLTEPVPARCRRAIDAERYAKRALTFKLLDPSMESGYLLLQTAISIVHLVHLKHAKNSKECYYLNRALLERLCSHCLWGIDRNSLAIDSVNTLFSLLAAKLEIPCLKPQNLLVGDSLEYFNNGKLANFDGVFNNPPWGESLRKKERAKLRQFSTIEHHADTYVAFAEVAIRCLRPNGLYGLVLPSQSAAVRYCCRMRELIASKSVIDHLVLLPRAAFADATVRGLVILGCVQPAKSASRFVRITRYPITKSFTNMGSVNSFKLPMSFLKQQGGRPWTCVQNAEKAIPLTSRCLKLKDVATVVSGVRLYAKGRGVPPQTRKDVKSQPFNSPTPSRGTIPAVRGRGVGSFHMKKAKEFVKFGPWLAQPGQHGSLRHLERVFVRELCCRDGKINAAIAPKGVIPLHGVLTVIPKMIEIYVLLAILNSRIAAKFVQQYTASFSKVDFQRIIVGELEQFPIPFSLINARCRRTLGLSRLTKREILLRISLTRLIHQLTKIGLTKSIEMDKLQERIEHVIAKIYSGKHT